MEKVKSRFPLIPALMIVSGLVIISMNADKFFDPRPGVHQQKKDTRQVRLTATSKKRDAAVTYDCADGKGIQTGVINKDTYQWIWKISCNSVKGRIATVHVFPDPPHPFQVGCSAYVVGYNQQGMFKNEPANQLGCEVLIF
jgi:hypothetical protein